MKKVLSCFLLLGSFSSFATVIQYNDFSDTTGLTLNGNTQVVNNNLQLTNNIAWQGGSVFTTNAISLINDSSFATSFSFKIDNNSARKKKKLHAHVFDPLGPWFPMF